MWRRVICASLMALPVCYAAEQLGYHDIKTDASGKIVPWYGSGPSEAYDHDVRLLFAFWKNMRNCPNGVPMYMQHQVWKPDKRIPAGSAATRSTWPSRRGLCCTAISATRQFATT